MKPFDVTTASLALAGALCLAGPAVAQVATTGASPSSTATKSSDAGARSRFVAAADADIAKGKVELADLEKKADAAGADAKAGMDRRIARLKTDVDLAETRLAEMKRATDERWERFEAGVSAATAQLRKSISTASG